MNEEQLIDLITEEVEAIVEESFLLEEAQSGDKKAYNAYMDKMLKKYKVSSPDELDDAKKKKFFNEVDAGWESDAEKAGTDDETEEGKVRQAITKAGKPLVKALDKTAGRAARKINKTVKTINTNKKAVRDKQKEFIKSKLKKKKNTEEALNFYGLTLEEIEEQIIEELGLAEEAKATGSDAITFGKYAKDVYSSTNSGITTYTLKGTKAGDIVIEKGRSGTYVVDGDEAEEFSTKDINELEKSIKKIIGS